MGTLSEDLRSLLENTVRHHLMPDARVLGWQELSINQGYSGSRLARYELRLSPPAGGAAVRVVVKEAPDREWRALARLNHQRHPGIPRMRARPAREAGGATVCMEDAGSPCQALDLALVAEVLAGVHARNAGRLPAWLPRLDGAFAERFVLDGCWREPWAEALADASFRRRFARVLPLVEASALALPADFASLCRDDRSLTLVHADLHPGHVLAGSDGRPVVRRCGWSSRRLRTASGGRWR
ncbi:MAG TPA: hypothetical protein VNT60_01335, partial [Deinococcales bacterium]|nr:hypothetical protein [Deinococcales bacterium]